MKLADLPSTVKAGATLALLLQGQAPDELPALWEADRVTGCQHPGFMQKLACRVVAQAYSELGQKDFLEYHIFNKLASRSGWSDEFQPIADAAMTALARRPRFSVTPDTNRVVKVGSILRNVAAMAGRGAVTTTPSLMRSLLAISAAGGAGTGAMWWLANRHASEDSTELEQERQKRDYYRRLTADVSDELRSRGIDTTSGANV